MSLKPLIAKLTASIFALRVLFVFLARNAFRESSINYKQKSFTFYCFLHLESILRLKVIFSCNKYPLQNWHFWQIYCKGIKWYSRATHRDMQTWWTVENTKTSKWSIFRESANILWVFLEAITEIYIYDTWRWYWKVVYRSAL